MADLRVSPVRDSVLGAGIGIPYRARRFPPFSLVRESVLLSIFPPIGERGLQAFHRFNAGAPSNCGSHPIAYLDGHRSHPVEARPFSVTVISPRAAASAIALGNTSRWTPNLTKSL